MASRRVATQVTGRVPAINHLMQLCRTQSASVLGIIVGGKEERTLTAPSPARAEHTTRYIGVSSGDVTVWWVRRWPGGGLVVHTHKAQEALRPIAASHRGAMAQRAKACQVLAALA
jgi:hypothetical protein